MIRFYLILAFCAVSFCALAQNNFIKQHSVYVSAGISIAPEDLAGVKSADNKGYVKNGLVVSVNYLAEVHRYIGLGVTLGHSRNNLNEEAVARSFTSTTTVESEPYKLTFVMADVYGLLPVKQWKFYAKGSLGSVVPDIWRMEITNDVGSGTVQSGRKFVPAYAAGLGLNYSLGKVNIGLESNLFASEPEFEVELNQVITYRKQWLSVFNHTIKAGFRF